ncbi:uncharacterized protein [Apostichopus japonicus]|uniref:uncharacterized protein n=1 Tax=Stichopus japonicus TaxID=307972 RepID=UPI003AB444C7
MADLPNRDEVISVLRRLIEAFEEILAQARKDIEDSPEAFSNQGIWKLEAVSDIYAEAFNSMGISHREQFDKIFFLNKYKNDEGILELHKQMLKLESELDDLMKTLDKSMDGSLVNITRAIVGSKAPLEDDIQLWLVPNKRSVYLREFLEASANLLLIFIRYYG